MTRHRSAQEIKLGMMFVLSACGHLHAQPCTYSYQCPELDGIFCTRPYCSAGWCRELPNNGYCPDDGIFCNGSESCSPTAGCHHTGDPCGPVQICAEDLQVCRDCLDSSECNDNNVCTNDSCSYDYQLQRVRCKFTPKCDDGNVCTIDTCSATGQCSYAPRDCNDYDACTADSCNPYSNLSPPQPLGCRSTPITCDDGLFCNGAETCNSVVGCVAGEAQCTGQICIEESDSCRSCENGGPVTRYGVRFDGKDDFVRIGPVTDLEVTDRLTLEAWILPTQRVPGDRSGRPEF